MIELLLQAERALTAGMTDQAERLYWQAAEADPRNSIAVMGLARVALERADDRTAYVFGRKALAIDAENPAAQRLVARLEEVMAYRGESIPVVDVERSGSGEAASTTGPSVADATRAGDSTAASAAPAASPDPGRVARSAPAEPGLTPASRESVDDGHRGVFGRILRRRR